MKDNFPLLSDWIIKKKLKDLKDSYQETVHRKGKTTEVEKVAYSASPTWREEVEADIILTNVKWLILSFQNSAHCSGG